MNDICNIINNRERKITDLEQKMDLLIKKLLNDALQDKMPKNNAIKLLEVISHDKLKYLENVTVILDVVSRTPYMEQLASKEDIIDVQECKREFNCVESLEKERQLDIVKNKLCGLLKKDTE